MGYVIVRTDEEVDTQLNKAAEAYDAGKTFNADLGRATIEWLVGDSDDPPIGD